jgi:hypothetical protein
MASNRDTNKRLKAIGLPIELCIKYERLCGIRPGQRMSFTDKFHVSEAMISALEAGVRNVELSSEDYMLIAQEVKQNEQSRRCKQLSLDLGESQAQQDK